MPNSSVFVYDIGISDPLSFSRLLNRLIQVNYFAPKWVSYCYNNLKEKESSITVRVDAVRWSIQKG